MNQVPLFDAKNRLSALVHEVESGAPVELTRHGKPVAVVLGHATYREMQKEHQSFQRRFARFTTNWPVPHPEGPDDTDPFADVRSSDPGRPVDL